MCWNVLVDFIFEATPEIKFTQREAWGMSYPLAFINNFISELETHWTMELLAVCAVAEPR
jgi:hypothetical protein